jgi:deoxycytidylate deaminase
MGICKKQTTIAVVVNNGNFWVGSNSVENEQSECPRKGMNTGEGYHLCKDICGQTNHAEVNACIAAGDNSKGATLYLIGHTYCCNSCLSKMKEYGIASYVIDGVKYEINN